MTANYYSELAEETRHLSFRYGIPLMLERETRHPHQALRARVRRGKTMRCKHCQVRILPGLDGWRDAVHVNGHGYVLDKGHKAEAK